MTEKWENVEALEDKIKEAAEQQFQSLKTRLKREMREEMITEVQTFKDSANAGINNGIKKLKAELTEELAPKGVPTPRELHYSMLKGEASQKRHNILFFGIPEKGSMEGDLKELSDFLSRKWVSRTLGSD